MHLPRPPPPPPPPHAARPGPEGFPRGFFYGLSPALLGFRLSGQPWQRQRRRGSSHACSRSGG